MSILTERKGRAGLNVPSRTQKEKRLNEEIWKKERMMNMNESTAGIFRRQRQLVVAVLTATLLATPLFTACDTGGEPQESPQGGGLPLSFLTTVEELRTRAELNTANLTTIGVFAYLTDGDFDQSTATPGFMFNQKVERAGNGSPWTYSPVKYWSNNTTDRLSFFAMPLMLTRWQRVVAIRPSKRRLRLRVFLHLPTPYRRQKPIKLICLPPCH